MAAKTTALRVKRRTLEVGCVDLRYLCVLQLRELARLTKKPNAVDNTSRSTLCGSVVLVKEVKVLSGRTVNNVIWQVLLVI